MALRRPKMPKRQVTPGMNRRLASQVWGKPSRIAIRTLDRLTAAYGVSVAEGDLSLISGKWYVTHAGLLRLAARRRCAAISVRPVPEFCDPDIGRWVFKANVYKARGSRSFGGYGDANPSNVSQLVRGAEMRIAETRAVNRALRKAYGIGLCSVEELGSYSAPQKLVAAAPRSNGYPGSNCPSNGQPRLRDQLCALIRRHNLNPVLVRAYARDFCGTQTLKEASRDRVESFITQLAAAAKKDRDGLACKLNSYAQPVEANP